MAERGFWLDGPACCVSFPRPHDGQWVIIGPFLPKLARRKDGRGRPWRENRAVLNGILWILRTGAPWDLPDRYPSHQTCHRRFQQWVRSGVLKDILALVAEALHDEGYLDVQEAFIDGTFAPRFVPSLSQAMSGYHAARL
jgi:transposase